jgi:predicted transcriptional regulator
MYTTIKISEALKSKLDNIKITDGESYEEVIEDLIEDHLALNPEFVKSIEKARAEAREGKVVSLAELKTRMKHA